MSDIVPRSVLTKQGVQGVGAVAGGVVLLVVQVQRSLVVDRLQRVVGVGELGQYVLPVGDAANQFGKRGLGHRGLSHGNSFPC